MYALVERGTTKNIQQAKYLTRLVEKSEELELLAPTAMNIVNFRYLDDALNAGGQDDLNAEILMQLHERGIATPSSTVLNSRFSIRVAICNHRSKRSDFEALVEAVVAIGRELRKP